MIIEALDVSEECLNQLKWIGFTTVEEVAEFLELNGLDHMLFVQWIPICFDELINQFRACLRIKQGQGGEANEWQKLDKPCPHCFRSTVHNLC